MRIVKNDYFEQMTFPWVFFFGCEAERKILFISINRLVWMEIYGESKYNYQKAQKLHP